MILPNKLQFYVAGSKVFGEYGDPWDFSTGVNWFPFARREMHVNLQGIYLRNSPVGGFRTHTSSAAMDGSSAATSSSPFETPAPASP
jgi:hypothetical protein